LQLSFETAFSQATWCVFKICENKWEVINMNHSQTSAPKISCPLGTSATLYMPCVIDDAAL
jgi:hypothetical protein